MQTLQQLGIALIVVLQSLSPALDGVMNFFTFLGRVEFYLLVVPLVYWAVDPGVGFRSLLVLLGMDTLGISLKLLFHQPRPYWLGGVKALSQEATYGIPSTHATDSLAFWGYLAYRFKKTWLWILVGLLVFFIGLSRLYLGMHFPHDVLFGWLIGLLFLWVFVRLENPVAAWMGRRGLWAQVAVGFAVSLVIILAGRLTLAAISAIPDPPAWSAFAAGARSPDQFFTLAGTLFGVVTGYVLMKRYAHFDARGPWTMRAGRYALGLLGVVLIYFGLDTLFGLVAPDATLTGQLLRYVRYALVGLWLSFAAPWVFLKLGLAAPAS